MMNDTKKRYRVEGLLQQASAMPTLSSLPAKILLRIIDNCAVETVGRLGLVNRKLALLTKQKLRVTPHQRLPRRGHRHTSQGIKCRGMILKVVLWFDKVSNF